MYLHILYSRNFFQLSGYKIIYNHSNLNRGDGTIVYMKNEIVENTEVTSNHSGQKKINSAIRIVSGRKICFQLYIGLMMNPNVCN